jgi:hypothetical protein
MAKIEGINVSEVDAVWIVDALLTIGVGDAIAAAFAIDVGLAAGEPIESLSPSQREAVVEALAYAPVTLEPLRRELVRSH